MDETQYHKNCKNSLNALQTARVSVNRAGDADLEYQGGILTILHDSGGPHFSDKGGGVKKIAGLEVEFKNNI